MRKATRPETIEQITQDIRSRGNHAVADGVESSLILYVAGPAQGRPSSDSASAELHDRLDPATAGPAETTKPTLQVGQSLDSASPNSMTDLIPPLREAA